MGERVFLRFVEIAHERACGGDGIRRVISAKSGERINVKMPLENIPCALRQKRTRAVLFKIVGGRDLPCEQLLHKERRLGDDLPRADAFQLVQQRNCGLFSIQLQEIELARGNIRISEPDDALPDGDGGNIAVLSLFEHAIFNDRAGGDDADDIPLHEPLCERRILHLLADGNLISLFNEFGDVIIHRMIGNPAHRRAFAQSAIASGKHKVEFFCGGFCILKEHLIEVPEAKEQQAIAIFFLEFEILPHHRRHRSRHSFLRLSVFTSAAAAAITAATATCARFGADAGVDLVVHRGEQG
ncbi:hypothetical protein SDC9_107284 [bioreactor metagenome]|uniref:Uncharacterized protein n=1 Tax=bioreactor metagenome TaxID=1076179 RepID=A0A645BB84_9ZZZZ